MTKKEVIARVQAWQDYYMACREYGNAASVARDIRWLKQGTNWRAFERGDSYVYGSMKPWYAVYPAEVASRWRL